MTTKPKSWEETMTPEEAEWCWNKLLAKSRQSHYENGFVYYDFDFVDNYRAARLWKSSQVRRFKKQAKEGCCGSHEWVAYRWNWKRFRFDKYLLGFNFGH